jgi:Fe2+ or Zn2+ uptake regulation protein
MAKIQNDILEKWFADLEKTDGFTKERLDTLRALFTAGKKPKATDVVKVLKEEPKDQQLP